MLKWIEKMWWKNLIILFPKYGIKLLFANSYKILMDCVIKDDQEKFYFHGATQKECIEFVEYNLQCFLEDIQLNSDKNLYILEQAKENYGHNIQTK